MAGVRAPIRPCGRRMGDRSRPSAKEGANGKMGVIPGGASVLWVLARCFLDVWPSLSPCVDVGLTSGAATKHRGRAQPRMLPRPPYSRIHLQIHPKLPAPSCGYESQYGRVGEIKKKKAQRSGWMPDHEVGDFLLRGAVATNTEGSPRWAWPKFWDQLS